LLVGWPVAHRAPALPILGRGSLGHGTINNAPFFPSHNSQDFMHSPKFILLFSLPSYVSFTLVSIAGDWFPIASRVSSQAPVLQLLNRGLALCLVLCFP